MLRSLLTACLLFVLAGAAFACPFCPAPQVTLSERLAGADVVALGQWVSADRKTKETPASTTLEILHLAIAPAELMKAGDRVMLPVYRAGRDGDLFLLLGKRRGAIDWDDPLDVTETGYQYVLKAPSQEAQPRERVAYYLKYLEYPDETIAADAFNELASAEYRDIAALAEKLPRRRIREWLEKPDFTNPRLGFFGLLLGLCGTEEDVRLLARHIAAPMKKDEFRLGVDGLIGGYLMLTGEKGLDFIDENKLRDRKQPNTELFSAMQALRFFWTYGDGRIGRERLKQSMRILLDRPKLADIAITDLARWKDWSVQEKLIELFDHPDYQPAHVKQAIISYTLAASRDVPSDAESLPEHVVEARKHLESLREKDPTAVRRAERLFLP